MRMHAFVENCNNSGPKISASATEKHQVGGKLSMYVTYAEYSKTKQQGLGYRV